MTPTHSALIVPVPTAEPAVHHHRARLDRAAGWGVPAHITILYPFLPPAELTADVLAALRAITATVPRFTAALTHVDWFGDTVAWLAPAPAEPFISLTRAVTTRFPQARPYDGAHPDVVPHLTIGHDHPPATLRAAAAEAATHLPITATIDTVHLIEGVPAPGGPWHTAAELPLGPAQAATQNSLPSGSAITT